MIELAAKDDPVVEAALRDYQRRNITNKEQIRQLLLAEHKVDLSYVRSIYEQPHNLLTVLFQRYRTASITRRRKLLGLKGSGATTKSLPDTQKRQLIMDQMSKHPTSGLGPRRMQEAIAGDTGIQLTRYALSSQSPSFSPCPAFKFIPGRPLRRHNGCSGHFTN